MKGFLVRICISAIVFLMAVVQVEAVQSPGAPGDVQESSRPDFEGEYRGQLLMGGDEEKRVEAGLEVRAVGGGEYRATLYYGGLPREQADPVAEDDKIELEGTYEDFTLELVGDAPVCFQYIHGRFTALDEENNYMGHLERAIRVNPDS